MDASATSAPMAAPRKRKRGGAGWKSNVVTYPDIEPKSSSVAAVTPPSKIDVSEVQYEEQESIMEDCDVAKFCREWCKWPRMGLPVHGARLIPMKCPLPDHFVDVEEEHRFTPSMAIRSYRSKGVPIGMIIALVHCQAKSYLTACSEVSCNWASSSDGEGLGITICTLRLCERQFTPTPEHSRFQLIPSEAEVMTFCQVVSNYLSRNAACYVAVHCCSGYNLTGFMIASYLIEMCNFSVDAAVDAFYRSRSPGIYTSSWLQALLVRYDDRNSSEAISLSKQLLKGTVPSWDRSSPKLLAQEISFDDLGELSQVTEHSEICRLQALFAKLTDGLGGEVFESVTPIPLLAAPDLVQIRNIEAITWRTKSPFLFLLLDGIRCYFVHKNTFFALPEKIRYGCRKDPKRLISNAVLLGEYIVDISDEGRTRTPRFLIDDLISFNGKSQLDLYNLSNRLECARHEIVDPARSTTTSLRLRIKTMSKPSQAESVLTNIIPSLPHESDGLYLVTSTGYRRSLPDYSSNLPRFLEWVEPVSAIKRVDLLSALNSNSARK